MKNNNETPRNEVVNPGRRRFARGAAAVPTVMATLASRPVWGNACTISGMASANVSQPMGDQPCGGLTPGYWKTHPQSWAGYIPGSCKDSGGGTCKVYNADGTAFHSLFNGNLYGQHTLMQVMWLEGGDDPYQLGAHTVAALLNAASPIINYGYTAGEIIDLYNARAHLDPEGLKSDFQLLNERG